MIEKDDKPPLLGSGNWSYPDTPSLKNSALVLSVALKKSWAKAITYWVQIYGQFGPNSKIVRWYVWCQWHFIDRNFIAGKVVKGGKLCPGETTSLYVVVEKAEEIVKDMVTSRNYDVADVTVPGGLGFDDASKQAEIIRFSSIKSDSRPEKDNKPTWKGPRIKEESFWDSVRQRERKCKW